MALNDFQEKYDNSYQEIFQKTLVSKAIANSRFQSDLTYGESLERFAFDIGAVQVRTVTRGSASTIDTVTDTTELIQVNIEEEATFHLSDGEMTQAGPLSPGEVIGAKVAKKVAISLDGKFFDQVTNADYTFDTGDLTTLASTGTGITLSSTTVPQMVARMSAKLRYRNQVDASNLAFVVDSYAASDIEEYLMSKNIDLAGATFKNGYAGPIKGAKMYVSENLKSTAVLTFTDVNVATKTVTINGVAFLSKATPAVAGDVDVHATTEEGAATNFVAAINNSEELDASEVGTLYCELTAANRATLTNARVVATLVDATVSITASGRLTVATTETNGTWSVPHLHAYFGKHGAIDMVTQDVSPVDVRKTADRRGANIFSSYLAGIKAFADGTKQYLDVLIV